MRLQAEEALKNIRGAVALHLEPVEDDLIPKRLRWWRKLHCEQTLEFAVFSEHLTPPRLSPPAFCPWWLP